MKVSLLREEIDNEDILKRLYNDIYLLYNNIEYLYREYNGERTLWWEGGYTIGRVFRDVFDVWIKPCAGTTILDDEWWIMNVCMAEFEKCFGLTYFPVKPSGSLEGSLADMLAISKLCGSNGSVHYTKRFIYHYANGILSNSIDNSWIIKDMKNIIGDLERVAFILGAEKITL
jgi:hypothetical protein